MATWIIVGGILVLALILGVALLLVVLATRGETDDDVHLPRFKRFTAQPGNDTASSDGD